MSKPWTTLPAGARRTISSVVPPPPHPTSAILEGDSSLSASRSGSSMGRSIASMPES